MKKYLSRLVVLYLLFSASMVQAQINSEFFGTKDDFKNLQRRILIVETLVENPNVIRQLNKKENKKKLIEEYRRFIKKYNEYIQISTYKYWTFNDSIEFRSEAEVGELKKIRSHQYALLSYMELREEEADFNEDVIHSIPAIKYTRLEATVDKPDYKIYIPSSHVRPDQRYIEADFRVAIMAMQENLKYMIKHNNYIDFQEFILDMSDKNCKKLKKSTVLVERSMLTPELDESAAAEHCKASIEFVSVDEIDQHMFYKTKGKSAIMAFPLAILHGKGDHAHETSIVYFKIAVDCETGSIIWTNGGSLGHIYFDNNQSRYMTLRDFKYLKPCD